jgi:hypothetical protein
MTGMHLARLSWRLARSPQPQRVRKKGVCRGPGGYGRHPTQLFKPGDSLPRAPVAWPSRCSAGWTSPLRQARHAPAAYCGLEGTSTEVSLVRSNSCDRHMQGTSGMPPPMTPSVARAVQGQLATACKPALVPSLMATDLAPRGWVHLQAMLLAAEIVVHPIMLVAPPSSSITPSKDLINACTPCCTLHAPQSFSSAVRLSALHVLQCTLYNLGCCETVPGTGQAARFPAELRVLRRYAAGLAQ